MTLLPSEHPDGQLNLTTDVRHLTDQQIKSRRDMYQRWVIQGELITVAGTVLSFDLGRSKPHSRLDSLKWKENGQMSVAASWCQLCKEINTLRPAGTPPFPCLIRAGENNIKCCLLCHLAGTNKPCRYTSEKTRLLNEQRGLRSLQCSTSEKSSKTFIAEGQVQRDQGCTDNDHSEDEDEDFVRIDSNRDGNESYEESEDYSHDSDEDLTSETEVILPPQRVRKKRENIRRISSTASSSPPHRYNPAQKYREDSEKLKPLPLTPLSEILPMIQVSRLTQGASTAKVERDTTRIAFSSRIMPNDTHVRYSRHNYPNLMQESGSSGVSKLIRKRSSDDSDIGSSSSMPAMRGYNFQSSRSRRQDREEEEDLLSLQEDILATEQGILDRKKEILAHKQRILAMKREERAEEEDQMMSVLR